MALGVKESVSGRRYALAVNGDEERVCAGKGAVYLSGPKVALRCCGKTSIVATRKKKQSVLRQGDVLLLGLHDHFYANGTLTKYEVVDMDAQPAKMPLTVLPTRVPSITMSSAASSRPVKRFGAPPTGTQLVSSYFSKVPLSPPPRPLPAKSVRASKQQDPAAAKAVAIAARRSLESASTSNSSLEKVATAPVIVDIEDSTGSSTAELEDEEEELAPSKRRRGKRSRAIVESDGEDEEEEEEGDTTTEGVNMGVLTVDSDVSSPRESDDSRGDRKASGSAARDWMAAFGRNAKKHKSSGGQSTLDGWQSSRSGGSKDKSKHDQRAEAREVKRFMRQELDSCGDESEDDEHYTRSHDEVGQLLEECEGIARELRRSVSSWSGKSRPSSPSTSPTAAEDEDEDDVAGAEQMSLATIAAGNGRRVISQEDIPGLCETLQLKPYQVVGVNWLLLLNDHKVSGVLADEMGLGKTVQTIAFLMLLEAMAKEKGKCSAGPHLVVVPASVLNNWKREFGWIAPTLRIKTYHVPKTERRMLEDELHREPFDVLLTTYSYFGRDACQEERAFLRSFQFNYMILDEGHNIKNSGTSRFKRITALRVRTRLVLSGTPIQNNLAELLALLSFLMPRMFDHGSDELMAFFDGNEQTKCAKVRKILAPFILRREKKYVLNQLGPKKELVEFIKLDEGARKVYTDLLESVIKGRELKAAQKQQQKEWKTQMRAKRGKSDRQVRALLGYDVKAPVAATASEQTSMSLFTNLRKAANHPVLLRRHYVDEETLNTMSTCLHRAGAFGDQCTIARVRQELESYNDFDLHDLCVQYSANEQLRQLQLPTETLLASAKFNYLRELLPKLHAEGHRVLIFSQWTKLLNLLENLMSHMEYRYMRLDGSTDVAERQGLIDTYNEDQDIFVFLLSTRAGGLGINLTAADTVILHDLDFNPTADEQACDRCHRIGQTKPVTIYKLVVEDTVDQSIYKIGQDKTELNHAVLDKLNAHRGNSKKSQNKADSATVEMLLDSVIATYKEEKERAGEDAETGAVNTGAEEQPDGPK